MSLHDDIMNIPHAFDTYTWGRMEKVSYLTGHRDARHAAAELAVKVDAEIERLTAECAELRAQLEASSNKDCTCRACVNSRSPGTLMVLMSTCPECGEKRCPRAENHMNACAKHMNACAKHGSLQTPSMSLLEQLKARRDALVAQLAECDRRISEIMPRELTQAQVDDFVERAASMDEAIRLAFAAGWNAGRESLVYEENDE